MINDWGGSAYSSRNSPRRKWLRLFFSCIPATLTIYRAPVFADTTATWTSTTGNWTDPTQWSTNPNYPDNGTPAATDYGVLIANPGSAPYTVSLNTAATVDAVTLDSSNATLLVQANLPNTTGDLNASSLNLESGTLDLNGTLQNATITQSGGTITSNFFNGTLENVTLASNLTFAQSTGINILNGINANGYTISFQGPNAGLQFNLNGSAYVLQNAVIDLSSGSTLGTDLTAALTLGSSTAVQSTIASSANSEIVTPTLTNQGQIIAGASTRLIIQPLTLSNSHIESMTLVNQGTIEANGTLLLQSTSWDNTNGTIEANTNAALYLGGSTSTTEMGNLVNNGTMILQATINNTGQYFSYGGSTGTWQMQGATINNGTVSIPSTTQILSASFNNATLNSNILLNQQGGLTIVNGLTSNGHTIAVDNPNAAVTFDLNGTAYTLSGATITLAGYDASLLTDSTTGTSLTVGSTTIVKGYGIVGYSGGNLPTPTLMNSGLIQASSGALQISPTALINDATIEAVSGGTAVVEPVMSFNNTMGTLQADIGGTIDIEGPINPSALGTLVNNGTMYLEDAQVSNTGNTLNFGTTPTASWYLANASVLGGSVNIPYAIVDNATFSGVTLGSNVTVADTLQVQNGLTPNGYAIHLSSAYATLEYLLNGSPYTQHGLTANLGGSVTGAPTGGGTLETDAVSGSALTLDSTCTVQGYGYVTGKSIINQGNIIANTHGDTLTVDPVSLVNTGTLGASNGGILAISLTSPFTDDGILDVDALSKITDSQNLALGMGSAFDVTLGPNGETGILEVTGNLSLSSESELNISAIARLTGTYEIATYTGTLTGEFGQITPGYDVNYGKPGEILVIVPEPGKWALLLAASCPLAMRRRRKSGYGRK